MTTELKVCRVVIADDHPVSLSGLDFMLSQEPGVKIVGHARDGREALNLSDVLHPDILVLDLLLPHMSGLAVLETLQERSVHPQVLVISGQASGLDFKHARDLGAEGIVSKEDQSDEILAALKALRSGHHYLSATVRAMILPLGATIDDASLQHALTPREREILGLVAEACSNADIGERLGISPKTAKKHRENVMRKLGASSAVEATRIAVRLGLVKISWKSVV